MIHHNEDIDMFIDASLIAFYEDSQQQAVECTKVGDVLYQQQELPFQQIGKLATKGVSNE